MPYHTIQSQDTWRPPCSLSSQQSTERHWTRNSAPVAATLPSFGCIMMYHFISIHFVLYHIISYHIICIQKNTCLMLRMPWTRISDLLIQRPQVVGKWQIDMSKEERQYRSMTFPTDCQRLDARNSANIWITTICCIFPYLKDSAFAMRFRVKRNTRSFVAWSLPNSLCRFSQTKTKPIH